MFRPFTGETLSRLVERLIASHDRAPRRLRLLYVNPEPEERERLTALEARFGAASEALA